MLAPHLLLKPSASVNMCEQSRAARLSDLLLHYFHYLKLLLRKTFIITELGIKELAQSGGAAVLLGSICGSREVFFFPVAVTSKKRWKLNLWGGLEGGGGGGCSPHPLCLCRRLWLVPKNPHRSCLVPAGDDRAARPRGKRICLFNTCSDGEQRLNADSKQEAVPVSTRWEKS